MSSENGQSLESLITECTRTVTKGWRKQRVKEERKPSARWFRTSYYEYSTRVTVKEIVDNNLAEVYDIVSGGGSIVATARQLFYRMRPIVFDQSDPTKELSYSYFSQELLPSYIANNCLAWKIAYDDRGHFSVPHTKKETIGVGTIAVDRYLASVSRHSTELDIESVIEEMKEISIDDSYPTKGVKHRCSAVLFIEKEGFNPILEDAKLCERYDLSLLSTKGQTVTAARKLVDRLCGEDCPLLLVHDFDSHGIDILRNAVTDNHRYTFSGDVNYTDFGLRLSDVEQWGLAPESCNDPNLDALHGWLEPGEYEFLKGGQRVELNAFTSPEFIKWLESKLDEAGIKKVVPDDDVLQAAYRRAMIATKVSSQLSDLIDEAAEEASDVEMPDDLGQQIRDIHAVSPELPWDKAILEILDNDDSE